MTLAAHHILVSDRSENVRSLLQREFSARGYSVSTAKNAEEVLHSLESLKPALLVMDRQLPGCDRPGFWENILSVPGAPFVVMHAFSDDPLPKALEGHAAHVEKDGNIETLARAVAWCLARIGPTKA